MVKGQLKNTNIFAQAAAHETTLKHAHTNAYALIRSAGKCIKGEFEAAVASVLGAKGMEDQPYCKPNTAFVGWDTDIPDGATCIVECLENHHAEGANAQEQRIGGKANKKRWRPVTVIFFETKPKNRRRTKKTRKLWPAVFVARPSSLSQFLRTFFYEIKDPGWPVYLTRVR